MTADLTQILSAIDAGDAAAAEQLLPMVYDELRQLAARQLDREAPGQTLQATALVHEAYLRLTKQTPAGAELQSFDSRAHFFGAAAESMRRILVERARARRADKRGGGRKRVELTPEMLFTEEASDDLIDLDCALQRLAATDATRARLVTLRFFGGLTLPEAAVVLGISKSAADRMWALARVWLFQQMRGDTDSVESSDENPRRDR